MLLADREATATNEGSPDDATVLRSDTGEGRFPAGTLLDGRYRVISLLGRGGMGEVYRAIDLTLKQPVALKFLPENMARDPRLLERLHAEARLARQISHPNVCRVYDIGEVGDTAYISMEYIDGEDLASLLRRIGRLPYDKGLDIARRLCVGLAAAHDKGVIHRDLKPANIMIDRRGEVLITDFGLARSPREAADGEARSGTPAYMAPEQLQGQRVSVRSDIYSLGPGVLRAVQRPATSRPHAPAALSFFKSAVHAVADVRCSGTASVVRVRAAERKGVSRCCSPRCGLVARDERGWRCRNRSRRSTCVSECESRPRKPAARGAQSPSAAGRSSKV